MSWFDASGIANLAKSALKEAQKTIDKALDIKEEEQKKIEAPFVDGNDADFFAEWGIKNDGDGAGVDGEQVTAAAAISKDKSTTAGATWGSFAGSFFVNPDVHDDSPATSAGIQPVPESWLQGASPLQDLTHGDGSVGGPCAHTFPTGKGSNTTSDSISDYSYGAKMDKQGDKTWPLSPRMDSGSSEPFKEAEALGLGEPIDTIHDESFSNTQLVVELNDDQDEGRRQSLGDRTQVFTDYSHQIVITKRDDNFTQRRRSSSETVPEDLIRSTVVRPRELSSSSQAPNCRISIVSSESDKKSSESVQVLGSASSPGTDCTTTPESDLNSFGNSTGSSATGTKINSDSVEILPDSSSLTTSPSSVEILGQWKSESSPFVSPVEAEETASFHSHLIDLGQEEGHNHTRGLHNSSYVNDGKTTAFDAPGTSLSAQPTILPTSSWLTLDQEDDDISPESVEVIPEIDESEEPSLADDSYASASESTILLTVVDDTSHQQLMNRGRAKRAEFPDRNPKMHDSCPDTRQNTQRLNLADPQLNFSLDSLKEKHNLALTLAPITTQPIRKPGDNLEFEVFAPLISSTIEPPNPDTFQDDVEKLEKNESLDCGDQLRQFGLAATEQSSCEGIPIESSCGENATLACQIEPKIITTGTLTDSSYVKNMLAEAMVEKIEGIDSIQRRSQSETIRDPSPISSERYNY